MTLVEIDQLLILARNFSHARETKYSTVEKECLAIKLGVKHFRTYIERGCSFEIETDHQALEWLNRVKDTNARLTRWSLFLQSYQFTVRYCPGKRNSIMLTGYHGLIVTS